jgi:hypothetical protein
MAAMFKKINIIITKKKKVEKCLLLRILFSYAA